MIRVTETLIRDTTETTIAPSGVPNLPRLGKLVSYRADLTGGTGTTIQPRLGNTTGFAAGDVTEIAQQDAAAANHNDQTQIRFYLPTNNTLYLVSAPNDVTADHAISHELLITDDLG